MKYKIYKKAIKIAIFKCYLQGERITDLTRELQPDVRMHNRHKNIYNWIAKYAHGEWYYRSKKISLAKTKYHPALKYNFVMRYLAGKSPTKLAREIWGPDCAKSINTSD